MIKDQKIVLLRCDATAHSGIGHLVRALSVADSARRAGWEALLAGELSSPLALSMVSEARLRVLPVEGTLGLLAKSVGATVVHLDDYTSKSDTWRQVHGAGAVLSNMEDGPYGRRRADVAIDSTVGAEDRSRPEDGSPMILRGVRFAPVRQEVNQARDKRASNGFRLRPPGLLRAVVVMGGTDAAGLTITASRLCLEAGTFAHMTVVATRSQWEAVAVATNNRAISLEPCQELPFVFADSDVVITAAGTTVVELATIGTSSLLVEAVENQSLNYEFADRFGSANRWATASEMRTDPDAVRQRLVKLVADISNAPQLPPDPDFDGLGADRIVEAWERLWRE